VAECKFLNNKLVEVVAFMENIALKDSGEKDLFFKKLPAMIPAIPEPVAIRKILPQLSNALEYGGAPATAVSSLLMIGRYGQLCVLWGIPCHSTMRKYMWWLWGAVCVSRWILPQLSNAL
jgi:hypothetical protein